MLMGAIRIVSAIPGIIRPAIATSIPNLNGNNALLLDVGLNPDARPDVLYQYGMIGSIYSKLVHQVEDPKVALLNIGSEEEKGNLIAKTAYQLMKNAPDFNFIGNLEANELFVSPEANVIVCDGFVGNIVLKEAEAFYRMISLKGMGNDFFEMFNFENFGGTPILGIQAPLVIGHGISNDKAVNSMLTHTYEVVKSGLVNHLKIELEK
jgi:glycerol-3-phosphate acyltransferase PlsX